MDRYTPGPWTATKHNSDWQIDAEHDAVATTVFCYAKEKEPNALLIAAAPKLLEALRGMIELYLEEVDALCGRDEAETYDEVVAARTAIFSATGEQR